MSDGLEPINLPNSTENVVEINENKLNDMVRPNNSWKKPLLIFLGFVGVLGLLVVILTVSLFMPLKDVYGQAMNLLGVVKVASQAIKDQDIGKTKGELVVVRKELETLNSKFGKIKFYQAVPFIGSYVKDAEHGIKAAYAGLDAADATIAALEPNADLLGLKGGSKFVYGNADERIQVAVKTMKAISPKITEIAVSIDKIRKELNQIDPNHYPEKIGSTVIRSKMVSAKETFDSAANLFINAQPLLVKLPEILGEPDTKRYLVLFQNDKELRSTGGFLTAYAQFRIERGKLILEKSDDIYDMDAALKKEFPAPREISTFHKEVYTLHIRDSNLSPDFKESMKTFQDMYEFVGGKENIDGIIAVDTHVLVETLKILGSMNVGGREFSADIDKRCNCPRAVYELEDYSTRPVNYVRKERKDIIGVLLQQLLQKALGVSPSQYWGRLFQMLMAEINQKHVLANFKNVDTQSAVENFNMAGRIMTETETAKLLAYQEGKGWDYLHINNSNMAGAKSNMFVHEKFTKDTKINADGTITTVLIVDYKNEFPGSDCNLERGGLCLNAPLRNWVRIYAPKGSKLVESKGIQSPKDNKPKQADVYDSLSKTVFEGFLIVNPLGTARLEITYTSPFVSTDGKYRLLFQKQPGTDGQEVVLKKDGKEKQKFVLQSDTEIAY